MEKIPLSQVMRLLEINNHRLAFLLEKTSIIPETSSNDRRVKLVTMDQVEQLRLAHTRPRKGATPREMANMQGNSVIATLLIRVETLEREVAALKRGERPAPRIRPENMGQASRPRSAPVTQIGIGKRHAADIAIEHGANSWKSALDWYWQESDLADERTALQFIKDYLDGHPRAGQWHICEKADHECRTL